MASNRPADTPDDLLARLGSLTAEARVRADAHRTQVELALALQRGMLPDGLPEVAGVTVAARYAPAFAGLNVGGDWYDGFVLPDGSIGYSIGDVQGHTIEAAAFMGQVRVGLRALGSVTSDPGELLARTNDLLLSLGGSLFATCTMVRFDPVTWELDSARAGHVPMVRATASGRSRVVEDEGGLPLGIEPGVEYPVTRYRLTERGAFVLVTDGVVEGPSLSVDEGLEQVATLAGVGVGAALGAASLATSVMRIADSIGHDDDAAVLVIGHDAPPPGAAPGEPGG
ncbi:PP2C family protein-serine/threonine phosphatase [Streptomyces sp. NPDC002454]|uniref:PP2C family protein-serine/threonine phosphatase n=1 Tax=Streptomyces sp. NPDC002490 TaxID=3154416 RepID=UPI0033227099